LAAADPVALRIEELHVYYGLSHVLQGVSLDVPTGQVTAIVGRNGVGKTTMVNAIMGLLPQTKGRVLVGDENLLDHHAFDRKRFGLALVPQGRRLFGSLTVEEHLHLVRPIAESPYDVEAIWELFPPLDKRRRALARTLSGGERSMLSVARALILNPAILLMDEPTEGLAPLLVDAIGEVVLKMREQGFTLLLVEQKLPFALRAADRIAVMERGAIAGIYGQGEIDDVEALSQLILHGEGGG
jgi:branched-chain amino acid transport system ATP-binding protein